MKFLNALTVFFCLIAISFNGQSQNIEISPTQEGEELAIKVSIPEGWHLYSMNSNPEIGPIPTEITFDKNTDIELVGGVNEPTPTKKYDKNFQGELLFFDKEVVFTQKIKVKKETTLEGSIMYMICNNEKCMPPVDKSFSIKVK